jgi:cytidyltransferase-like protein
MGVQKPTLGLVLGRFQPIHPGHLTLINQAMKENDQVVVCIGSAQKAEPYTIEQRHEKMQNQLTVLGYDRKKYRIVDLVDPKPMEIWPTYIKKVCEITDATENNFYRGEDFPQEYKKTLQELGFNLRIIERNLFYFMDPEGYYHLISSAREIKEIYRKSGKELL